jgi:AraC family transcriptional regulator of adaptative response/methylated-DNA-[protein]-cysteine methyltransferase
LHDLFVTWEAVTGEYKLRGEGLQISYGFHPTPFGEVLLGTTDRGICNLSFVMPAGRSTTLDNLRTNWPKADLDDDPSKTQPLVSEIFRSVGHYHDHPLHLYMSGSNFQLKVGSPLEHPIRQCGIIPGYCQLPGGS